MKGRTPNAEERLWLSRICDIGCIVCLEFEDVYTPACPHHMDGKTKPEAHLKTIPLCGLHHQGGADNDSYTSRHPYKARFEARYGTEQELLEKTRIRLERE